MILVPLILIVSANFISGEKFFVGIVVISYLTATTKYAGDFRIYINLFFTTLLIFRFIKDFGLKINEYPKLPFEIIFFLISLSMCLFLSSLFSVDYITGFYSFLTTVLFFVICYALYSLLNNMNLIYTISTL